MERECAGSPDGGAGAGRTAAGADGGCVADRKVAAEAEEKKTGAMVAAQFVTNRQLASERAQGHTFSLTQ